MVSEPMVLVILVDVTLSKIAYSCGYSVKDGAERRQPSSNLKVAQSKETIVSSQC